MSRYCIYCTDFQDTAGFLLATFLDPLSIMLQCGCNSNYSYNKIIFCGLANITNLNTSSYENNNIVPFDVTKSLMGGGRVC